ncbi:hypothetical protein ACFQ1S_45440, partial [Kibdelosporangium lantanae]
MLNAVVEAAVSGDTAAIHWLLSYVRPLVLRYCQARIGGHPSAVFWFGRHSDHPPTAVVWNRLRSQVAASAMGVMDSTSR